MSLLPPGSTTLERRAAAALSAETDQLPVTIKELHDPDRCPVRLLPYLAWARSVDRWDESWTEQQKRNVIKQSAFVHSRKGTVGAIKRVVEPFGYVIRVVQWFEENPPATPGTFRLDIGVLESGIDEETYNFLQLLIDDAKAQSRHMTELAIYLESHGAARIAATAVHGDTVTVYPPESEDINIATPATAMAGIHSIDTMSIFA